MKRIGLFFGAGAEINYGLPSGGKFAIDLFRQDPTIHKGELREKLKKIDITSSYSVHWLPDDYLKKPIYAFGEKDFINIIESSIEYRQERIIAKFDNFDSMCKRAIKELNIDETLLNNKFKEITDKEIGEILYSQKIKMNDLIAKNVKLFASEYYSAMLEIVRSQSEKDDLQKYVVSFLQLLVGAHGHNLVKKLNEELFTSTPDDLPIFDDIFGIFRLEYHKSGSNALELLLRENKTYPIDDAANITSFFSAIGQKVLEYIFVEILDYQKLIDNHYRYLYCPKYEWAKFTRMVIFLEIAREYITRNLNGIDLEKAAYYKDLKNVNLEEINIIGTANYNNIISKIIPELDSKIIHLNGSVNDYYNPYKNTIINDLAENQENHILVPFLLTQSGIKPLTSVEMSRRYVDLFDKYKNSDVIISVGFGFNQDDGHINGLFRDLIENHNKKLFIIDISSNEVDALKMIKSKLRVGKNFHNIKVISVDRNTRKKEDKFWYEIVFDNIEKEN
ncbi:MAG: hypothetical protein Q4C75_06115 [Bergeyella zoohelcum]|nr:hypothetical protein [Bergeyella zoohelcum]